MLETSPRGMAMLSVQELPQADLRDAQEVALMRILGSVSENELDFTRLKAYVQARFAAKDYYGLDIEFFDAFDYEEELANAHFALGFEYPDTIEGYEATCRILEDEIAFLFEEFTNNGGSSKILADRSVWTFVTLPTLSIKELTYFQNTLNSWVLEDNSTEIGRIKRLWRDIRTRLRDSVQDYVTQQTNEDTVEQTQIYDEDERNLIEELVAEDFSERSPIESSFSNDIYPYDCEITAEEILNIDPEIAIRVALNFMTSFFPEEVFFNGNENTSSSAAFDIEAIFEQLTGEYYTPEVIQAVIDASPLESVVIAEETIPLLEEIKDLVANKNVNALHILSVISDLHPREKVALLRNIGVLGLDIPDSRFLEESYLRKKTVGKYSIFALKEILKEVQEEELQTEELDIGKIKTVMSPAKPINKRTIGVDEEGNLIPDLSVIYKWIGVLNKDPEALTAVPYNETQQEALNMLFDRTRPNYPKSKTVAEALGIGSNSLLYRLTTALTRYEQRESKLRYESGHHVKPGEVFYDFFKLWLTNRDIFAQLSFTQSQKEVIDTIADLADLAPSAIPTSARIAELLADKYRYTEPLKKISIVARIQRIMQRIEQFKQEGVLIAEPNGTILRGHSTRIWLQERELDFWINELDLDENGTQALEAFLQQDELGRYTHTFDSAATIGNLSHDQFRYLIDKAKSLQQ